MNAIDEHCVAICNGLLRKELEATLTYEEVIGQCATGGVAKLLRNIWVEHVSAADELASNVREMGGTPAVDSGISGSFENGKRTESLLKPKSAIQSLKQGEELARSDYENALQDENVMADAKILIRDTLIPRINRHISTLDTLE